MQKIAINEQRILNQTEFPLIFGPQTENITLENTLGYISENLDTILNELKNHGAILFRGFPINDAKDFNDFCLSFGWEDLPYIGGAAVRKNVYGVVFTANEAPPDQPIPFHHEMAQVPKFPSHLFFYCDVEPSEGGETPLCLSNAVYERINSERPEFIEKLRSLGVKYTRVLPDYDDPSSPIGRSWRSTFMTESKEEAEKKCIEHGGSYEWLENDCLKTVSQIFDPIRLDERTGKLTWFNSIVAVYYGWKDSRNTPETAITYGDGTPLNLEDVKFSKEVLDELCVSIKWKKSDVILVDNRQVLHARNSFVPPRRILAALFQ
ncbi:unnamed protein product [Brachionus calyciflorus]|uniref:TauD/TfdA-like domain-containing protein n=1 Tax=Brachionus calyciflorus TaxID=104777 RepID=A0A813NJI0_9BILA|nr:unnamed protein product [Brachionus calyciflorus]